MMTLHRRTLPPLKALLLLAAWAAALPAAARADQAAKPVEPARLAVLEKAAPENLEDLRALEKQVKKVLDKVVPCTVGLRVGGASGSGVIVSEDGYVLTAAHVSAKPDRDIQVLLSDGRRLKGKTLGLNRNADSGLVKITDEGKWPFAEMGNAAQLKKGQWLLTVGHPGGYNPERTAPVRLGRYFDATREGFLCTDCTLVGGDSGGPLFDLDGRVVGVHSHIGDKIEQNFHVPVDAYRDSWDRLVKGEAWGRQPGGRSGEAWLGVEGYPEGKTCEIKNVMEGSPAEKGGLKANDVVTKFDGKKVETFDDLSKMVRRKRPGDEVALEVLRANEPVTLKVKLGKAE